MVEVPTKEDFDAVVKRLDSLERENNFLRSLLLDLRWMSVAQVAKACNCSVDTIYRLVKLERIESRYEGTKIMCSLVSVRNYLTEKNFSDKDIEHRLISGCHTNGH